jgi:hypothetical protein
VNVFRLIEEHGLTLHGDIEHFAELVRADEREACAQIVEGDPDYDWHKFCCEAVAKIRARGEK